MEYEIKNIKNTSTTAQYRVNIGGSILDFTIKVNTIEPMDLMVGINELSTFSNMEKIHDTKLEGTEFYFVKFLEVLKNFIESVSD